MENSVFLYGNQLRQNHGAYPIFSLQQREKALIRELQQNLQTPTIPLPGVLYPEIGFCIPRAQLLPLYRLLKGTLKEHFTLWLVTPPITPLPDYSIIPDECLEPLQLTLAPLFAESINSITVQNLQTQEQAVIFWHRNQIQANPPEALQWRLYLVISTT